MDKTIENGLKKTKKILVLGGSGFVGNKFIEEYQSQVTTSERDYNVELVSLSRRGLKPLIQSSPQFNIVSVQGDATNESVIADVFLKHGPFDGCVHAMGLLLDSQSGNVLMKLNKYASGSGSEVTQESTYDKVTRQSAFSVMEALASQSVGANNSSNPPVFIFISAAEAGWKVDPPVDWLRRYLLAKRQVETKILSLTTSTTAPLRGVIFRPSLIWTWDRPQALLSVIPFYLANKIGISFIDRPVTLESLVQSMVIVIENQNVSGIQRYVDIDNLLAGK
eukprot:CAMPEP_0170073972 /NCGR_PEP_ID=MMETSP0019_2-20121128/11327_1 /TAXON_ID=98059 /ORGANISM="Dinobryon sp., Strain UTEXLB2267" /LENGTH=278 /DNA_ID=CAMNT_0010283911 /DNA_START=109 /DNA_END=945 /DNA_ORIENTATION=+